MNTFFNFLKCNGTGRKRLASGIPLALFGILLLACLAGAADTTSVKTASTDTAAISALDTNVPKKDTVSPGDTVSAIQKAVKNDTVKTADSVVVSGLDAAGLTGKVASVDTRGLSDTTEATASDSKPAVGESSVLDKRETGSDSAVVPKPAAAPADATVLVNSGPFDKLPLSPVVKNLLNRYWVYGAIGAGVIVVGVVVGVVVSGAGKGDGGALGPPGDPDLPPIDIPLPGSR